MNEIQSLREQIRSDFEWTTKALAHQRDVVEEGFRQVQRALGETQETLRELATRVDRNLGGFGVVLERQGEMLQDHEERLRRLEQDRPPAA